MKIAFAGTPAFACIALQRLLAAGHTVALVLTQPDRPAGRGLRQAPSAVKEAALAHRLPLAQPHGLRLDGKFADDARAAHLALAQAEPEVMVVAAYGLILPQWVLDLPRLGCLNIHASLLPRWRGAAPVQRAIEAGDSCTGVTIMQVDAGLDTGDIWITQPEPIRADDTATTLTDRLARIGGALIVDALDRAARGTLAATVQPPDGVTYAHKIDKRESQIDWSRPAGEIERRIRAFDPFPGASTVLGGAPIKIWRGQVVDPPVAKAAPPGTVLHCDGGQLVIACGVGALALQVLQRAGGRRIASAEFLAGHIVARGARLGD